jgi:O-antigen/teichoic acid export membrane protein
MVTPAVTPLPSLRAQAFWLTLSKFLAVLVNAALPVLLVRVMNQTDYGVYKQTFMFSATMTAMASLGVGVSAFYFIPRYPERGGQIAWNILIYNFSVGMIPLILLWTYPQFLERLFRTDALSNHALLMGFIPLLTLTSSLIQHIPTALQDVKNSSIFIVGTQVVKAMLLAFTAVFFPGVKNLLIAYLIGHLFTNCVVFWYLHKKFGAFWTSFEWKFFKQQLAYALPFGSLGLLFVIKKDLHNYFVSAAFGPTDFAIYAVGCMQIPFIFIVLESVGAVMVIRVSALQQQGRSAEIRRLAASAINRIAAIHFPVYALLLVVGRDLIVLLYTKTYEASYDVFAISILMLPISAFMFDSIIRTYLELRKYVILLRIGLLVILAGSLTFVIRHFGMIGAVSATVGFEVVERLLHGWRVSRVVQATRKDVPLFQDLVKLGAVTLALAILGFGVRNLFDPDLRLLRITVATLCMGTAYVACVYAFRLPGWEEISKDRITGYARAAAQKLR